MKNFRSIILSLSAVVLMLTFVLTSCSNGNSNCKKNTDSSSMDTLSVNAQGEKLVKQIWDDFKNKNFTDVEKFMATGFQSVHDFGAYNSEQELKLIKKLVIHSYRLSNIQITKNGTVIIATYMMAVEETINGERLTKKPASRMSVFTETEGEWKWIAHANLRPVVKPGK